LRLPFFLNFDIPQVVIPSNFLIEHVLTPEIYYSYSIQLTFAKMRKILFTRLNNVQKMVAHVANWRMMLNIFNAEKNETQ